MAPNRKNVQAKLILYDMKSKLGSVKILEDWKDIPTHNKTYEGLSFVCDKIENAIQNKNMDLAKTWLKKVYVRLKKMRVKHPISETEFTKYLNDKNNVLKFTRQLNKTAKAAAAVMKYEGVITKSITLLKDIGNLSLDRQTAEYNEKVSELKANRDKLKGGYEKMKLVMDSIDILGECAPSGMTEMIEFYAGAFKAAEKAVKFVYNYAGRLEKWMAELDKETKKGTWEKIGEHNWLIERGVGVARDRVEKVHGN